MSPQSLRHTIVQNVLVCCSIKLAITVWPLGGSRIKQWMQHCYIITLLVDKVNLLASSCLFTDCGMTLKWIWSHVSVQYIYFHNICGLQYCLQRVSRPFVGLSSLICCCSREEPPLWERSKLTKAVKTVSSIKLRGTDQLHDNSVWDCCNEQQQAPPCLLFGNIQLFHSFKNIDNRRFNISLH